MAFDEMQERSVTEPRDRESRGRRPGLLVGSLIALASCKSTASHETSPAPADAAGECVRGEPESAGAALCDRGDLATCEELAAALTFGRGMPADPVRAADLLQRACDGGRPSGCLSLGLVYFEGHGRPKDEGRAWELMLPACARDPEGCGEFGNLYAFGLGVPKNPARAVRLLTLGCDGGDGASCADLAVVVSNAEPARADALRQRACALGDIKTCRALGLPAPRGPRQPRAVTDGAAGD